MIIKFYPGSSCVASISFAIIDKTYDLADGSLATTKDEYTGHYSAEAFLIDLEEILTTSDYDTVIIRKVRP